MDEDWGTLPQGELLQGPQDLQEPRSIAIATAVQRHSDFELVRCMQLERGGRLELLVVDAKCHAVPPNNPFGIEFIERIAMIVGSDAKQLVEVLAVRRGFPRLMHQNARPPGCPPSLCLYFEPPRSVTRSWTPESFLGRIKFWLEKTARGELHPADQPVEQIFFTTSYELVLPWNVDTLLTGNPKQKFDLFEGVKRTEHSSTFLLQPRLEGVKRSPSLSLVSLRLPPVVHGRIEEDPPTLGLLADMLSSRRVDLVAALELAISAAVGSDGAAAATDSTGTVILLDMPITRAPDAQAERRARRAYLVNHGALKLGEMMGELHRVGDKYWRVKLLEPAAKSTAWKSVEIEAIEVLQCADQAAARRQAGTVGPGLMATLVGAGALGATMLDLWVRSGWGEWTVVDKDHVKPHNLVRHPADLRHLGHYKEQVAAARAEEIRDGAAPVTPVHADACDLVDGGLLPALRSGRLVVDASTTLEYPRLASAHDDAGRHTSVFLTPSGSGCALLLEDAARTIRLRSLEAQYYRAVITQDWGEHHLEGSAGTFWSGASCRDISVVMPYSAVQVHAALLAEQVQKLTSSDEASVRVWSRDAGTGAVALHELAVHQEHKIAFDDMDLFTDAGVTAKMRALREHHLPNETGGILLGYHDLNINAVVVVDALEAPSDSRSSPGHFERGVEGVASAAREASRRTAGIVGYVGEWHSHPKGHGADPSADDFYQLVYLALGMAQDGLPAVSLIVGDKGDLRAIKAAVGS